VKGSQLVPYTILFNQRGEWKDRLHPGIIADHAWESYRITVIAGGWRSRRGAVFFAGLPLILLYRVEEQRTYAGLIKRRFDFKNPVMALHAFMDGSATLEKNRVAHVSIGSVLEFHCQPIPPVLLAAALRRRYLRVERLTVVNDEIVATEIRPRGAETAEAESNEADQAGDFRL
jgi:hypothetical protein